MADLISQFVSDHGGPTAIARAAGFTVGSVSQWKQKGRIPRTAWPELITVFSDVTLGQMLEIERLTTPTSSSEAA